MKFTFYGAAGCVTGSCHILELKGKKILLDCGLFQGRDEKERSNEAFHFNPEEIDYVILSHAHIDHSGRIPLLYQKGFKGKILCTEGTKALCSVMLPDSGHIQEMEVEWKNRKRIRQGLPPIEPLYTAKMAAASLASFEGHSYDEKISVFPELSIRFRDAGHVLGSAMVEIFLREGNKEVKIVYSGDLGNLHVPIIKDPTLVEEADYVILETTYGNREHNKIANELKQLVTIIKDTFQRGGNVIIPSFAVGRTQEVLYALNKYIEEALLPGVKVYVDSPLAAEATKIFQKYADYYDEEAKQKVQQGDDPLAFQGLSFTQSAADSIRVNKIQSGAVVIAASGMCEAGRIKHHLKHNLWRKESSIVFVGYQAEGTLGKEILDGTKKVKLFGEEIAVNAKIYSLPGLSGHADRLGLLRWVEGFIKKPKEILLVHGDDEARESFEKELTERGYICRSMQPGETYTFQPLRKSKEQELKQALMNVVNSFEYSLPACKEAFFTKLEEVLRKYE